MNPLSDEDAAYYRWCESAAPTTDRSLSPARFTHRELAQINTGLWIALSEEVAAIPRPRPFHVEALAARYRMVAERMGDTPDPVLLAKADRIIREAGLT